MPDWVVDLLREALRQSPIVLLLGVLAWYAFRYIRQQHSSHLTSLSQQYEKHLHSKDDEIQRLQDDRTKEVGRLVDAHTAEIGRLTKLLADAQKERDRLRRKRPPGKGDS
jgi:predicted negative regulator of RcsB-dependent stress response